MSRDRRSRRHGGSWRGGRREEEPVLPQRKFHPRKAVSAEQVKEEEEAIRIFKATNRPECAHCHQPIVDMTQAILDRGGNGPIHFDCALEILDGEEKMAPGERITYIGQGRFGIVSFPHAHDMKHFTIRKVIEWEEKDGKPQWRNELASLYSRVR